MTDERYPLPEGWTWLATEHWTAAVGMDSGVVTTVRALKDGSMDISEKNEGTAEAPIPVVLAVLHRAGLIAEPAPKETP